jgi:hypothetical protein
VEWKVLVEHAKAVARTRVGKEPGAGSGALVVEVGQVLRSRMRASHLGARLAAGGYAKATEGGLQDSAPRDAQLALHARLDGVDPDGWEHPTLAQVWFRSSDYVVPRDERGLAAFTLGTLPRAPEVAAELQELADVVLEILGGEPMSSRRVTEAIPDLPNPFLVKLLSCTGKVHIRWDASRIDVLPAEPAAVDPEDARVELARRFLHWLGPAGPGQFARWAGIVPDDARATWQGLAARHDLVRVDLGGRGRWILADDEAALRTDEPLAGVRLLPMGDPVLWLDRDVVVPPMPDHLAQRQPDGDITQRVLNSLQCRVLLDGTIVASWGRAGGHVTLAPWRHLTDDEIARIEAEAHSFATALGRKITLRWLT